jgi:hypothetical protein
MELGLRTKSNIPMKQGALLMGVPDFTSALAPNEIFIQIIDQENAF